MPSTRTLQEVVLAVHFATPVPFSFTDIAAWIEEFGGAEFAYQQLPTLPAAQMPVMGQGPQISFQLVGPEIADSPRIRVNRKDNVFYILQDDRLGIGWQRKVEVGEEAEYPGYEELREFWVGEIIRFEAWIKRRMSAEISSRLVELSYNNAFPLEVDGARIRISDIFKLLDVEYRPVNFFQVNWAEFIDGPEGGVVNAQGGLANIESGARVFALNYFGLSPAPSLGVVGGVSEAVALQADKVHQRILDMHRAVIISPN